MTYKIQIDNEVRSATPDEIAIIEAQRNEAAAQAAADENNGVARIRAINKLAELGLTEAEIKALVG
jgi:hypothetical protein